MGSSIATFSIERPLYILLLMTTCFFGGLWGIDTVGRLEDPVFPMKYAYIITPYPGASALEVEQEVTDVVEAALQEVPYIDTMKSKSLPGRSEIQIKLMEVYGDDDVPQIWDEMRRRVTEVARRLPPGAQAPLVEDDFGDIYGILYAISTPDYAATEIDDMAKFLATRLNRVPGVAKVSTAGEPQEAVHVELEHERLVRLGMPAEAVFQSISIEGGVVAAGSVASGGRRLRVAPELAFESVDAIADMPIGRPGSTEIMRLGDIADIDRAPVETPPDLIRHNQVPVFTLGVSISKGQNVVTVGEAVDRKLESLLRELPLGVEATPIYKQHAVVRSAINDFLKNLLLSVATVVGALCLFMGWRAGTIVGSVLLMTVLGTIGIMAFLGIELQRISLGALMIAMGMLVDNAIVVAEGQVTGVKQGMGVKEAAARAVGRNQFPLLGATVIGILAFAPIGLSADDSGYFLRSLFQVVAISLLLSWVLAITVVPLLGAFLLKPRLDGPSDLYTGWAYRPYRSLLKMGLRRAWLSTLLIFVVTGLCLWGFSFVKQGFFPGTNTPLLYVDYYMPQGTDILTTASEIESLETVLLEDPMVTDVTSFIGRSASRFTATTNPTQPNPAMAQLVIRVGGPEQIDSTIERVQRLLVELKPDAEHIVYRSEFSPAGNSKIEARFSGPRCKRLT